MARALILEDDISTAWDYEILLKKLNVELAAIIKSWDDVLPAIRLHGPDFILIDLFLSQDQLGFKVIKEISDLFIPMIICTGYPESQYIKQAIGLGVEAFLSKPVDVSALEFHIVKLLNDIDKQEKSKGYLMIKQKGGLIKVPYDKIVKINIEGNYSYLMLENGKRFVLKQSLNKTLEELDPHLFMRCHRTTAVNISFVSEVDSKNQKIRLTNGEEVDLGNRFRKEVRDRFRNS